MKKRLIFSLTIFCIVLSSGLHGQDVSFSQFYSNPLYLNPAFSGSVGVPRVALQYRNQWRSIDNAFNTYSAAFDMPVPKLQGGIGLHVVNDAIGNNLLNALQVNLSYSVYIQLSKEYRLHGGIQAGFNQNSLRTADLVFADNLDQNYGHHGVSAELASLTDPNFSFVDFASGVLVYGKKLFYGLAVHHLTEPRQTFYEGQDNVSKIYRKYSAHLGARLPVYRHGHHRKKFDISPQLVIQKQGPFQQVNYGIFATKRGLTGGTWFRQNFGLRYDALIFLVGYVKKNWQFTYTYDWTVSGLWGDTGGTSELTLAFLLKSINKNQNMPFYHRYEEEFGVQ